jgi:uncharacterized repeat protein (TIGR03803 family)
MRSCSAIRAALLGSALALTALAPAFAAETLHADLKRQLAAHGPQSPAFQKSGIATPDRRSATYTDLYDFAGRPDGSAPTAEVTLDDGNLFGTTAGGGEGAGTIFKRASDGTESVIYSFPVDASNGQSPDGALTITAKGDMYGTTSSGGAGRNGVLYKLSAKGEYTVLHAFSYNEGSSIRGRLVRDELGNLYGTALFGGAPGNGTVFKYAADGTFSVLHTFTGGSDGQYPQHGMVRDSAGNLYGATGFGGASGMGTVYKIAPDGTLSTVYSFTGGADGGFLFGGIGIGKDGNLYGSTVFGGANSSGTVFKLTPAGALTTLYNFTGGADGGSAKGEMLVLGGKLYSTTSQGGDPNCGCGVIYEINAKGKYKVLHTFTNATGGDYSAGLTKGKDGMLYGTTSSWGANSNGTVFSITKR